MMSRKKRIKPPTLAERLLGKILPEDEWKTSLGDFEQYYKSLAEKDGKTKADIGYWRQVFILLPKRFLHSTIWRFTMFSNYLKIAMRHIHRQRGYAFINIAGLAVGMACLILILLYVDYEFSYESHNPNADRVYRIYVEHMDVDEVYRVQSTPVPLAKALHEEIPEIEDYTRVSSVPNLLVSYGDKKFVESDILAVDPGVFDILGFSLVSGEKTTVLDGVYSIVVTEEIASKYFGDEDPVGKTVMMDTELSFMVSGVIQNHPHNTDFSADILISMSTLEDIFGEDYANNWLSQILYSYLLVPENQSVEDLESKIETAFSKYRAKENDERRLKLECLNRIRLYSIFGDEGIRTIRIFMIVGIVILVTACINFMNLATARSSKRAREVGMRKVAGAQRKQIVRQFLGESFLYAVVAGLLGILLAFGFIPMLSNLTGQSLSAGQILQAPIILSLIGTVIIVGFLAGSYPALYLSAFHPTAVIKESVVKGTKGALFRRILVIAQFSISIMLIACTFVFTRQIKYMNEKPLGFKQNQIVVVRNPGGEAVDPFKQMLKDDPRILSVCASDMLPHRIGRYNEVTWEGAVNDEVVMINHNDVDYDFVDTYEIPIVAGRNFSRDFPSEIRSGTTNPQQAGALLLNETAVKRFGWDDPIGKEVIQVFGETRIHYTVIGVLKDFHYSSLKNPIMPMKLFLGRNPSRLISIKVQPQDIQGTLEAIEAAWSQFNPNHPFDFYFYDSVFAQRYQEEQNLRTLFRYFSLLAIFIGCLGLFGLASFAAERRTKEMGIRKILGASGHGLIVLISKDFAKWVLIANIIAWPIAYYVMHRWLNSYAYHTTLELTVFILSGILALGMALITVSYQAFRAASTNPANALKYE